MCIRDRDVIIVASVSCIYSLGDPGQTTDALWQLVQATGCLLYTSRCV